MNKLTITVLILTFAISSCRILYVPDIQQGNVITDEMLSKLKTGMNPGQVKFVLGSPLIMDPFHKERWDYFYSYKDNENGTFKKSFVSILFKDNKVIDINIKPKRPELDNIIKPDAEKVIIEPKIHDKIGPGVD